MTTSPRHEICRVAVALFVYSATELIQLQSGVCGVGEILTCKVDFAEDYDRTNWLRMPRSQICEDVRSGCWSGLTGNEPMSMCETDSVATLNLWRI